MPDKKAALPGLPPPEEEVLEFESSTAAEDQDVNHELDEAFPAHIASDNNEDGKMANFLHFKTLANTHLQTKQHGRTHCTLLMKTT